jgi:hypothetical protein
MKNDLPHYLSKTSTKMSEEEAAILGGVTAKPSLTPFSHRPKKKSNKGILTSSVRVAKSPLIIATATPVELSAVDSSKRSLKLPMLA